MKYLIGWAFWIRLLSQSVKKKLENLRISSWQNPPNAFNGGLHSHLASSHIEPPVHCSLARHSDPGPTCAWHSPSMITSFCSHATFRTVQHTWCPATDFWQANPRGQLDCPTTHFSGSPNIPTKATDSSGQPPLTPQHWNWLLELENWQKYPAGHLAAPALHTLTVSESRKAIWAFGHPSEGLTGIGAGLEPQHW